MARGSGVKSPPKAGAVKAKSKPAASSSRELGPSDRESISVRKISNGYVVTKSTDSPKGYKSEEMFSPTRPKLDFNPTKTR